MSNPGSSRDLSRIPTASKLREPTLETLRAMGGRATNTDIDRGVAERIGLSAEDLAVPHNPEKGTRTEFAYRMAWARTRLKKDGLITNVATKVWSLSEGTAS
jgi:restriction system protein